MQAQVYNNNEKSAPLMGQAAAVESNPPKYKYFRPWIIRLPFLAILLAITLALVGLTEYACWVLPPVDSQGVFSTLANTTTSLRRRQDVNTFLTQSTSIIPAPSAPPPSNWLHVGSVTISPTTSSTPPPTTAPNPIVWLPATTPFYVFTPGQFFLGAYLPTILAVLFAIPFVVLDYTVKKLEPLHQLEQRNGASARSTLLMDYFSPFSFFAPLKAVYYQQWPVFITSLLSYACILITPLAPETVFIHLTGTCSAKVAGCTPSLGIFIPAARTVEALLAVIVILIITLMVLMRRRSSGTFSNPFSLAGIACIFQNREVLSDFQRIEGYPSEKRLTAALSSRQYKLDFYTHWDGSRRYGIVRGPQAQVQYTTNSASNNPEYSAIRWRLQMSHPYRIRAVALACMLWGLLAVIIYYRFNHADNGFERFMDTQGFGVRFLFTAIGVLLKLYWGSIFQDIATLSPYTYLSKRHALAHDSILLSTPSSALTAIPSALRQGHFFFALVALTAVLAEILTVSLSNVPFNNATSWTAFIVSTWLSVSIICVMQATLFILFFYAQPKLPLQPKTVAAVMYYLCGSHIPEMVAETSCPDTRTRDRRIEEKGMRYALGLGEGTDGVVRIGVDAEGFVYEER